MLLLIALLVAPALAGAQTHATVNDGSRVRLWTSNGVQPVIGRVIRQNATTMTLEVAGGKGLMVTRETVTRLEVSKQRSRGATVAWGMLFGAIGGFIGGAAQGDDPHGWTAVDKGVVIAVPGAMVGLITGLVIGPGKDHWSEVGSKTTATLTPVVTRRRIGLAGSVRW